MGRGRDRNRAGGRLGLGCALAGACCLFDPFITVFDVLPDAVGFALIAAGLRRLARMNDRLRLSAVNFARLAAVGFARLCLIPIVFGAVSQRERPAFILLALFSLAVVDLIFLFPAWREFGRGMEYLAIRHGGTAALAVPARRGRAGTASGRTVTERYASSSFLFFLAREALAVLPELTVLLDARGGADPETARPVYEFVGGARKICAFAVLLLGAVFLARTFRYARRLASDGPFLERLRAAYAGIGDQPGARNVRIERAALACLCAGAALTANLYLDGVNALPDAAAAALFLAGALLLRLSEGRGARAAVTASALYLPLSLLALVFRLAAFGADDPAAAPGDDGLYAAWGGSVLLEAAVGALGCAALILLCRLILRRAAGRLRGDPGWAMRTEAYREGEIRRLGRRLRVCEVLGAVAAASDVLYRGAVPLLDAVRAPEWYPAVDAVVHLALFLACLAAASDIRSSGSASP